MTEFIDFKFYKETRFKETPIGKIPEDWKIVRLKEVLLLLRNGLTVKQNKDGKGHPITRIETISEGRIDLSKLGYVSPSELKSRDIDDYRMKEGDILFSHINSLEHIGKTAIYDGKPKFLLHGMNLLLLRPNVYKVYPRYLLYLLRLFRRKKIFWTMSKKAVNQASINQTELGRMKIPLPPLPEQKAIAHILSTIDKAIQKTNEIIEKTERLKKGLMQELLTKGIGHKEFKDTEIGRIPREWNTYKVYELFKLYKGTTPPTRIRNYWNGNIPFATPTDITKLTRLNKIYLEKTENCITEEGRQSKGLKVLPKGSLLLTSRATIGYLAINKVPLVINQGIISLIPKNDYINILFFYYFFQKLKEYFERLAGGSTYREISISTIAKIKIPLPPIEEQKKIAEILSTIDKKLELERKRKEKLERIKKGTMDLLLTGKVRVREI